MKCKDGEEITEFVFACLKDVLLWGQARSGTSKQVTQMSICKSRESVREKCSRTGVYRRTKFHLQQDMIPQALLKEAQKVSPQN